MGSICEALRSHIHILFLLISILGLEAQQPHPSPPVVISKQHPVDSLGETVYSYAGKDSGAIIVEGTLMPPKALKAPAPEFTKALRQKRLTTVVTVSGVVTPAGVIIDLQSNSGADSDAAASALEAVRKYRFSPATLNGKPVAMLIAVRVPFEIY